jgi:F420-non-reducing hydrogenase iron-sulfur subunit
VIKVEKIELKLVREKTEEFEPRIVVFCCNWCSYASVNAAGTGRIQYPPNVRIIRSLCTARIDPVFVLESFINGAEGVLVLGCPLGECYYDKGNYIAEKRMKYLKKGLEDAGIDSRRFRLEWVSAYKGERFVEIIREMAGEIKKLGLLRKEAAVTPVIPDLATV